MIRMFVLSIFMGLVVVGCGKFSRAYTDLTGGLTYKCSEGGVQYVQSDSGLSLHVNKDGKPVECKP